MAAWKFQIGSFPQLWYTWQSIFIIFLKKVMGLSKTAFNYCVSLTQDSQHENMRAKKQEKEARVSQIHRKNPKFRSTNTLKKHLKPHFPWLTIRLCCTRNRKKKDFLMKRVIWNWTTKYWRHEGANIWRTSKRLVVQFCKRK